jgi:subtilisin-like proprotein convertase family protein
MNWKLKSLIAVALLVCGAVFIKLPSQAQSLNNIFSSETVENASEIPQIPVDVTKGSDSPSAIFSYTGPAVTIPDNLPAGVNIVLPVSGSGNITDLNFVFNTGGACDAVVNNINAGVNHTWVGDLVFRLTSPAGTTVTFIDRIGVPTTAAGFNGNNFCAATIDDAAATPIEGVTVEPVAGTFSPNNPLAAFNGQNANGNWTLNVSDNAGIDTGAVQRFSLDITAGPANPSLSVNDVSVTEGNSGSTNATFTVTLAPAAAAPVSVTYTTADQTATAPSDYTSTTGSVIFAAGETTKTFTVPVIGDATFEPNETFAVNLTAPTGGAVIGDAQGIGTITNDDASPLPPCNFNNGGLNPQATAKNGTAAPAGKFWSEVQNDTGNTAVSNTNAGSATTQGGFRLADNFTVPAGGCQLSTVTFFAYQTGSPATPSPFTAYTLQIWNGRPGDAGATVVFGDTTTNRLASSVDSNAFRIFNTVAPPPGSATGTTRVIWRNTLNVNTALATPGTYWLDWASTVSNAGAHFAPTKTIEGSRGAAGDNARQQTVGTGVWIDVVDAGNPATPPSVPQDFPFFLNTLVTNDAPVDFDGDGKTDFAVVRNVGAGASGATNQLRWFYNLSSGGGTVARDWGVATDRFVAEDFDGDGKDDITVWRPGAATVAAFYILQSQTNTVRVDTFGQTGDDPTVVGDYDGDNKADVAVYRSGATAGAQSTWFYRGSLTPSVISFNPWGSNGDFPAPGDYNGDGRNDFVIQRITGTPAFWSRTSAGVVSVTPFGTATDIIVPGDYDGDGRTDIATARAAAGAVQWQWLPSSGGAIQFRTHGISATDSLVHGDYDGDGRTDIAVWRPAGGQFWMQATSNNAITSFTLGATGDASVATFNTH